MKIHRLDISWSISRGRDTYGYNICRLDDSITGRRFRCSGGGYDMIGTVFADWFVATHPEKLLALKERHAAGGGVMTECGYNVKGYTKIDGFYGLTFGPDGKPHMDGGCGISSMISIVKACGLEVEWSGDKKGRTRAYYVYEVDTQTASK